ncbi:hypothetical protein [Halorubrum sp. Atlit-26R]|uniref:hypothetical protein n=1 Tax=Halorubrum sp. Atlit-26R TaxID=2282128 RepID=UPI000EF1F8B7|nr:hypothetical protein [Halorubrum sp. Atlit-26R]RLM62556.1 hypothetical protein DVK07_18595 [Halorubrum sp. Atlit-26R]
MSDVIGAQVRGELRERFDAAKADSPEDISESELLRELLDEGLRARQVPLYNRLGVEDREGEPNPVGAQLEAAREPTESQEDVVRRFLGEAVEARQRDVFDELGAPEDLREAVEVAREEGEPAEDALRRLIRQGIEAQERDLFDAIGAGEDLKGRVMERAEDDEEPDDTVRRLLLEGTRRTSPVQESTRLVGGSAVALVLFALVFGSLPSGLLQTTLLGLTTLNTLTTGIGGVLVIVWVTFMIQLGWRAAKERLGD